MKGLISEFLDSVALAQSNGDEWVEAPAEIIQHYNRKGMNGSKYFIYHGVKVCEEGKLDEILASESKQHDEIVFGSSEGKLQGL